MAPEEIKDTKDFDEKVKNAAKSTLVVVDFWATWCGPCKKIGPKFRELSAKHEDVLFFKVDVDEHTDLCEDLGINLMPTFKFFKGGECVDTLEGSSEPRLIDLINKHK